MRDPPRKSQTNPTTTQRNPIMTNAPSVCGTPVEDADETVRIPSVVKTSAKPMAGFVAAHSLAFPVHLLLGGWVFFL